MTLSDAIKQCEDEYDEEVNGDPWILRLARWEREKQALAKLSPEVRAVLDAEVAKLS